MEARSPIKRHPALVSLSRDHHFGLLLSWKIRQGMKKEIAPQRISRYVLFFFEQDLQLHFKEEEQTLFSLLPQQDGLRQQAEKEHRQIYQLTEEIRQTPDNKELLNTFADVLEAHIRFEERTLFNHLQQSGAPQQLDKLAEQASAPGRDIDDRWEDHFWEVKK